LGNEAAHDGSNNGTEQGPNGKDRHRRSSLLLWNDVGHGTTSYRKRSRACTASDEAKGKEHAYIGAHSTTDRKDEEDAVTDVVYYQASIQFRPWGDNQWTKSKSQEIDGHC